MRKIIGLMAAAKNGAIGLNGQLPWRYPDELRHFRSVIGLDSTLIMGRVTFDNLPASILHNRRSIVFSRNTRVSEHNIDWVKSFDEFIHTPIEDISFMIGGGKIADMFMQRNQLQEFVLTVLKKEYEGDTFLRFSFSDQKCIFTLNGTKEFEWVIKSSIEFEHYVIYTLCHNKVAM